AQRVRGRAHQVGRVEVQVDRFAGGIDEPGQPALGVVLGGYPGSAQRVDDPVQVVGGRRAVDELCRVAGPVGDGHQVAVLVVAVTDLAAHRVRDGADAPLRVALERHADAGGACDAIVAERQRVAVGVRNAAELAGRGVDVVGDAVLGRQGVAGL